MYKEQEKKRTGFNDNTKAANALRDSKTYKDSMNSRTLYNESDNTKIFDHNNLSFLQATAKNRTLNEDYHLSTAEHADLNRLKSTMAESTASYLPLAERNNEVYKQLQEVITANYAAHSIKSAETTLSGNTFMNNAVGWDVVKGEKESPINALNSRLNTQVQVLDKQLEGLGMSENERQDIIKVALDTHAGGGHNNIASLKYMTSTIATHINNKYK